MLSYNEIVLYLRNIIVTKVTDDFHRGINSLARCHHINIFLDGNGSLTCNDYRNVRKLQTIACDGFFIPSKYFPKLSVSDTSVLDGTGVSAKTKNFVGGYEINREIPTGVSTTSRNLNVIVAVEGEDGKLLELYNNMHNFQEAEDPSVTQLNLAEHESKYVSVVKDPNIIMMDNPKESTGLVIFILSKNFAMASYYQQYFGTPSHLAFPNCEVGSELPINAYKVLCNVYGEEIVKAHSLSFKEEKKPIGKKAKTTTKK